MEQTTPIGFHVTMRLEDGRPFAVSSGAFRVIARVVHAQGAARGLLAFGTADDHLHAVLATDRARAGAFARYVESALRARLELGARFARARIRPLQDQRHAYNTFHYVHRQDTRHELDRDPAREGTSLPDLLGLRVVGRTLAARVHARLPRIRRAELAAALPALSASDETSAEALDLDLLADAAAAAFALPHLRGRSPETSRARAAAVHAVGSAVASRRLGDCLGIDERTIRYLRDAPIDQAAVAAVRGQAALRGALSARRA